MSGTKSLGEAASSFAAEWQTLDALPRRSKRSAGEKEEARSVLQAMAERCHQLVRENRVEIYDRLTDGKTKRVRVDEHARAISSVMSAYEI